MKSHKPFVSIGIGYPIGKCVADGISSQFAWNVVAAISTRRNLAGIRFLSEVVESIELEKKEGCAVESGRSSMTSEPCSGQGKAEITARNCAFFHHSSTISFPSRQRKLFTPRNIRYKVAAHHRKTTLLYKYTLK